MSLLLDADGDDGDDGVMFRVVYSDIDRLASATSVINDVWIFLSGNPVIEYDCKNHAWLLGRDTDPDADHPEVTWY